MKGKGWKYSWIDKQKGRQIDRDGEIWKDKWRIKRERSGGYIEGNDLLYFYDNDKVNEV